MRDERDYKLELSSGRSETTSGGTRRGPAAPARPFIQAMFACCNVYHRIYRHKDGDRYEGACPRCGRRVRFIVGEGGTSCRSFVID